MSSPQSRPARADTLVVLDFETTGLSPNQGDRAIEIGAVLIEQGVITASYQQLMNPGFGIGNFIEQFTGISNGMLAGAPHCAQVMAEFADFIGDHNLVAHNASFDRRFLDAELARLRRNYPGEFCCSMLLARRLYPQAANHKLASLVAFKGLAHDGVFHRALADAKMTAELWLAMLRDLEELHGLKAPSFQLLQQISTSTKAALPRLLRQQAAGR
ncbi:3'-5' exonuclease [Shewanella sp. AS16]|uniref:3'-5' exonuclease n=1 Tax=Shewanella sp. AS16 TaxID=2907625 RepID=UPI001F40A41B|nr:3'-5' exonuclease [Shewanella sp. AS16]MCE9687183.1 3'-5' exonuclease [Shewanella sp. AS16]